MSRVIGWAERVAVWLRWLALWFANQRALHAHNVRLERQLADARAASAEREAAYRRELELVVTLHDEGMTAKNATIAGLDRECEGWKQTCTDAKERVKAERVLGNKAWQEVARLNLQLGGREVAQHASAAIAD